VTDLWEDEGFGSGGGAPDAEGEDEWEEGDESLESELDDGFDDPDELEDEDWNDGDE